MIVCQDQSWFLFHVAPYFYDTSFGVFYFLLVVPISTSVLAAFQTVIPAFTDYVRSLRVASSFSHMATLLDRRFFFLIPSPTSLACRGKRPPALRLSQCLA